MISKPFEIKLHTMLLVANYAILRFSASRRRNRKRVPRSGVAVSAPFAAVVVQMAIGVCWIVALK